jgi:hypothetical protein
VTVLRILTGALGVGATVYGAVALLDLGSDNLWAAAVWLAGGVLLHDGALAPLTIAAGAVAVRLARGPLPGPVVVGAVVLTTVTVVAIPVLGRFGARADNPTLLDRNYVLGWLVLATLTVVVVLVVMLSGRGGGRGASAGRR